MDNTSWQIDDPDSILKRTEYEISAMEFNGFICNEIIPRDILLHAVNRNTKLVVNLGYSSIDSTHNNTWFIALNYTNERGGKSHEQRSYSSLVEAISQFRTLISTFD
ncbi:hypothetical protein [Teredinibacter sp. KSP-S5-2]|uniref:hypothetical protein n=1 Tax=Teredinibacter sp. KSP-S5-2 TaxID=3034506 RepID=UPI0029345425|nr:hypothetical protein [Teredinibacter sp. KSP-S5-2]WNO10685.1 hypothetical protein P5V12_05805 [Teredinibacter sp. KSP-S5-2]